MYLKQDKFIVVGISKSGIACARFLLSKDAKQLLEKLSIERPKQIEKKIERENKWYICCTADFSLFIFNT